MDKRKYEKALREFKEDVQDLCEFYKETSVTGEEFGTDNFEHIFNAVIELYEKVKGLANE